MTLQLSHIFLTEALTFIAVHLLGIPGRRLLVPVRDPPAVEVVGRKLDEHPVARQDADEVLAHLSRDVRQNLVPAVFNLHPNMAFGRVSTTFAITSIASSFAIPHCVVR